MNKLSFTPLVVIALIGCFACQITSEQEQEGPAQPMNLEFELVKTLEYDYLGRARLMDYSEDLGLGVLYDDQRDEFILANDEEIIVQKKLSGDSKNSYGAYFSGALFWKDKLIVFGLGSFYFIYDLDLNKVERVDLPYSNATPIVGGFTYNRIVNDWLFYYGDPREEKATLDPPANPVTIWNLADKSVHATITTPANIPQVWNPGGLGMSTVLFAPSNDRMLLMYPYHPVIYEVDIKEAKFTDSILVEAQNWEEPDIIKRDFENRIEAMFDELSYPAFKFLYVNDDLLLTAYESAIPKEEVAGLPRNILGGEKWMDLQNMYRKPALIAIKGESAVAEMEFERGIPTWIGEYKITTRPIGAERIEVEEDFIRFYFYKPVLKPIVEE